MERQKTVEFPFHHIQTIHIIRLLFISGKQIHIIAPFSKKEKIPPVSPGRAHGCVCKQ